MTAYQIPTEFLNQNPNSKATFRPGGDAAYVSYLLGGMINWISDYDHSTSEDRDFETEFRKVAASEELNLGFSDALRAKFRHAADRLILRELDRIERAVLKAAKASAKSATVWVPMEMTGHAYKIGRWAYPVAEAANPAEYVRNTKVDGSGEWIPAEGGQVIDR